MKSKFVRKQVPGFADNYAEVYRTGPLRYPRSHNSSRMPTPSGVPKGKNRRSSDRLLCNYLSDILSVLPCLTIPPGNQKLKNAQPLHLYDIIGNVVKKRLLKVHFTQDSSAKHLFILMFFCHIFLAHDSQQHKIHRWRSWSG